LAEEMMIRVKMGSSISINHVGHLKITASCTKQ